MQQKAIKAALVIAAEAVPKARMRKRGGRQPWARLQIRMTVEAMHRDGVPLADLTKGQIMARCCIFMREKRKLEKAEIPKPRSFERYLSGVVREVLASRRPEPTLNAIGRLSPSAD
jgi:hypothetical protein